MRETLSSFILVFELTEVFESEALVCVEHALEFELQMARVQELVGSLPSEVNLVLVPIVLNRLSMVRFLHLDVA